MDYGFFATKADLQKSGPMLVVRGSPEGLTKFMIAPAKGAAEPWVAKTCAQWIDIMGHSKVVLKHDNEPAIVP